MYYNIYYCRMLGKFWWFLIESLFRGDPPPQMGCISPWKTLLKPGQVFAGAAHAQQSKKLSTVTSVFVSDAKTPLRKTLVLTPICTLQLSDDPH